MSEGWNISTIPRWLLCPYPNSPRDNEGDVMIAPVNYWLKDDRHQNLDISEHMSLLVKFCALLTISNYSFDTYITTTVWDVM